MRRVVLGATLIAAVTMNAGAQNVELPTMLGELLKGCACAIGGLPSDLPATLVNDHAELSDDETFIVAFRKWEHRDRYPPPIHVIKYDRRQGTWTLGDIQVDIDRDHNGTLGTIERSNGLIVIDRRVAIDGSSKIFLSPGLEKLGGIYYALGDSVIVLPNGLVFYRRAQPRFAPTHWVEIALFDTGTQSERDVYPLKPYDSVRRDFVERVRRRWAARGQEWFNRHNHHGNPEWFDSDTSEVALNWTARALAFIVSYADQNLREAEKEPAIWQHVMVVCTGLGALQTTRCRETPLEAWKRAYPGVADDVLPARAAATPDRITP